MEGSFGVVVLNAEVTRDKRLVPIQTIECPDMSLGIKVVPRSDRPLFGMAGFFLLLSSF